MPYSALARVYDRVMDHVEYENWMRFALGLMRDFGLAASTVELRPQLLECACGTGVVAGYLAQAGYSVDGFDRSTEMIAYAKRRAAALEHPPRFFVASFDNFPVHKKYDGVLCLYDSVNYLMTMKSLIAFFMRIGRVLADGAPFVFDICTRVNSELYFKNRTESNALDECRYTRITRYDEETGIQTNRFEIHFDDQPNSVFVEEHQQMIYPSETILTAVESAGLRTLAQFNGFTRQPPDENALRIHFVVSK